jgi:ATP-dependent DNA helicase RecQ
VNHLMPVNIRAKSLYEGYESKFFQTMSIPFEILDAINKEKVARDDISKYSQWRMEYRLHQRLVNNVLKEPYLLVQKILMRGILTLQEEDVEKKIKSIFNVGEKLIINPKKYSQIHIEETNSRMSFTDSDLENKCYLEYFPKIFGPNFYQYILPQVYLESLVGKSAMPTEYEQSRVDFLITLKSKTIVLELDGKEHKDHQAKDIARDEVLQKNGYEVIRVENKDVSFQKLQTIFGLKYNPTPRETMLSFEKYMIALKLIHQVQVALTHMLIQGLNANDSTNVTIDFSTEIFTKNETASILQVLNESYNTLVINVMDLFRIDSNTSFIFTTEESEITIAFNENHMSSENSAIIHDLFLRGSLSNQSRMSTHRYYENPKKDTLEYFLKYIFRKDGFREGQLETIQRGLSGKDTLVLLPTGAGKSIAFQLTSILLNGVTIVIDPIVALIQDQIENLNRIGVDRIAGITGMISTRENREKTLEAFAMGEYIITFVAPERMQLVDFRESIQTLTSITPIPLVAIDEAHCVSEWGHDFRTSYLNIGRIAREFCGSNRKLPCIIGLTGTASNIVLRDVQRELNIVGLDAIITPLTFNREELSYDIFTCLSDNKLKELTNLLKRYFPEVFGRGMDHFYSKNDMDTYCGLVFCPHVNGSFGVFDIYKEINRIIESTSFYSGEAPKKHRTNNWNEEKSRIATDYKNNKFNLLVTTKAFGMGIDKPNIYYTVHYGLPNSIESFYQEAGRAGRNRNFSRCIILLSNDDEKRTRELLDPQKDIDELHRIMLDVNFDNADDVTRAMFFHTNSFSGIEEELRYIKEVLDVIKDLSLAKDYVYRSSKNMMDQRIEKALYRLIVLGVVKDYTLNYSTKEYTFKLNDFDKFLIIDMYAQYVAGYSKSRVNKETEKLQDVFEEEMREFILKSSEVLIRFIYDTIEKGRRRAFSEMLQLAESAKNSDDPDRVIRDRVIRYFETTYSEEIEKILNVESLKFDFIRDLIDGYEAYDGRIIGGLRSTRDAEEIRGQVSRYLESYPDNPGLLMVRALSEAFSSDYNKTITISSFEAALKFANEQVGYSIKKQDFIDLIAWSLSRIGQRDLEIYEDLSYEMINRFEEQEFARKLMEFSDNNDDVLYVPSNYLVNFQCSRISQIVKGAKS